MYLKGKFFCSLLVDTVPNLQHGNVCYQNKDVLSKEHCKGIQTKSTFSTSFALQENVLLYK